MDSVILQAFTLILTAEELSEKLTTSFPQYITHKGKYWRVLGRGESLDILKMDRQGKLSGKYRVCLLYKSGEKAPYRYSHIEKVQEQ